MPTVRSLQSDTVSRHLVRAIMHSRVSVELCWEMMVMIMMVMMMMVMVMMMMVMMMMVMIMMVMMMMCRLANMTTSSRPAQSVHPASAIEATVH